jgi:sterol 3beta-glucosyltransferase
MTVNVNSAEWARRAGIEVVPMSPDIERFLHSQEGQGMLANGRIATFFRELAELERRSDAELLSACREAARDADLVLSTIMTIFRGTSIAEAAGVPNLTLSTVPLYATGEFASYLSPREGQGLPLLNRLSWHAYMAIYWRGQRDMFNGTRASLGLRPWRRRPRVELTPIVHMYSAHLRPLPKDLPPQVQQSAFATVSPDLRARLGEASPPEGLDAWIEAGSPPVFFGFGSMPILDPGAFLAMVARLCDALDIRALIGAGWSAFGATIPAERIFIAPTFDHDR